MASPIVKMEEVLSPPVVQGKGFLPYKYATFRLMLESVFPTGDRQLLIAEIQSDCGKEAAPHERELNVRSKAATAGLLGTQHPF